MTVARNPKSIRWQNGDKNLGRIQAQSGGQFYSGQQTDTMIMIQGSSQVRSQIGIGANVGAFKIFHPVPSGWRSGSSRRYGDGFCWGSVPMAAVSMRPSQGIVSLTQSLLTLQGWDIVVSIGADSPSDLEIAWIGTICLDCSNLQ